MKMVLEPALYGRFWASDVDKVLLGDTIVIKEERKPRHGRHGELWGSRKRTVTTFFVPPVCSYEARTAGQVTAVT